MAKIIRDEFRNDSGGFLGVITIDNRGDRHGVAVAPGGTIWLSEEEQIETANAPRSEADNPLINGGLVLVSSGHEVKSRRPLRPAAEGPVEPATPSDTPPPASDDPKPGEGADDAETGATPEPDGEPEEGAFAPGEEVATPDAAAAPKPQRRRRPTGAAA